MRGINRNSDELSVSKYDTLHIVDKMKPDMEDFFAENRSQNSHEFSEKSYFEVKSV